MMVLWLRLLEMRLMPERVCVSGGSVRGVMGKVRGRVHAGET
jgi:hypothetical protein